VAQVVDAIGAGDTFNGALAAALARGLPIEQAMVRANAAAALSVQGVGRPEVCRRRQ
jgi:ribokinase